MRSDWKHVPKDYIFAHQKGRDPQDCTHGWVSKGKCVMCGIVPPNPTAILPEPRTYCQEGE